jgi:hypothetical protein
MNTPDTNWLQEAAQLAEHNLRVLPITRGKKHPPIPAWQKAATTDPSTIYNWWTGIYRDHGIGIATGDGLIVLDIDTHGADGYATLADLQQTHSPLPPTVTAHTGTGGQHLYFVTWQPIRNNASTLLGPGIDIRGEGGQVLAPPTIHPNGTPYKWADGHAPWEHDIADLPQWLEQLLTTEPTPTPTPKPNPQPRDPFLQPNDSPLDTYRHTHTWHQLLTADGWTEHHTDNNGVTHWTRPGKTTRDGSSATTGHNGQDALTIFTTSLPHLPPGTYSKAQYTANTHHQGDLRALTASLRPTNPLTAPTPPKPTQPPSETLTTPLNTTPDPDTPQEPSTWAPQNLTNHFTGTAETINPTILHRSPTELDEAFIYPERLNMIYGESSSGKSWIALHACLEQIRQGNHVIYIDLEDHPTSIVHRLKLLGATPQHANNFHYIRPETPNTQEAHHHITQLIQTHNPTLITLDSYGETLALFGIDQNDDKGVAHFVQAILRPWTRQGPAVLILDHVTKNTEGPRNYSIGSQRKRASIDGAAYRAQQTQPFTRDRDGHITLTCTKDRGGKWPIGQQVATITVTTTNPPGKVTLTLHNPDQQPKPHTQNEDKILKYLTQNTQGTSPSRIGRDININTNQYKAALDSLHNQGLIRNTGTDDQPKWQLAPQTDPDNDLF